MLAQLSLFQTLPATYSARHLLVLLPKSKTLPKGLPHGDMLTAVLNRRGMKADELTKSPISANTGISSLVVWAMLDFEKDTFTLQTQVRKALQLLLEENPKALAIAVLGNKAQRKRAAELAAYGAWVNGSPLPVRKKKDERKPLQKIELYGYSDQATFDGIKALASGNLLCRELTVLPPNELTPGQYRVRIKKLAVENGWKHKEFDMKALRKMSAGAFVAVAQGSDRKMPQLCISVTNTRRRNRPSRWSAKGSASIRVGTISSPHATCTTCMRT